MLLEIDYYIFQVTDEFIQTCKLELLSGGMDSAKGRSERDHIQIGELLEEETTLKPGMDSKDEGLHSEAFLIGLDAYLEDV